MAQIKVYIKKDITDKLVDTMHKENIHNVPSAIRWVLCKHFGIEYKE